MADGIRGARSRSLDNLDQHTHVSNSVQNAFGLSESKLNKRYLSGGGGGGGEDGGDNLESISQRGGRWDDVGLSVKTALNDRYFSQPDLPGIDTTSVVFSPHIIESLDVNGSRLMFDSSASIPNFFKCIFS